MPCTTNKLHASSNMSMEIVKVPPKRRYSTHQKTGRHTVTLTFTVLTKAALIRIIIIIIIIIIVIIIIIIVITCTQGIYNQIPETRRVSRVYSVAAVLYLQFVLHVTVLRP